MLLGQLRKVRQGVLSGELSPPSGAKPRPASFVRHGRLHDIVSVVVREEPHSTAACARRAPHYSIGLRSRGRSGFSRDCYVRKDCTTFIGWTDVVGQYSEEARILPDGRRAVVYASRTAARRFLCEP